jgi:hypothetical protein
MFLGLKKYHLAFLVACLFFFGFTGGNKKQTGTYPELGQPSLLVEGTPGKWDEKKVHTFSIVEANKDGYKYWGYYGLDHYTDPAETRKGGLVRSNDLVNWVKYEGNPVIPNDCRWPTAVIDKGVFNVFYAEYTPEIMSRIVRVTSKDGIHFGDKEVIAPFEKGLQNQNPFIYFNKADKKYYLFYYHGRELGDSTDNHWDIMVKSAKDISKLKDAKPKLIMTSKFTIAAPSVAFYNGKYYLLIEAFHPNKWDAKWVTLGYESKSIDKGYKEVGNNPVLKDDDACAFQYVLKNNLYVTYSHRVDYKNNDWILNIRKAEK